MQWCNGSVSAPSVPAGQVWCITAQSIDLVATGLVRVTERYYGAGDPKFLR